MNSPGNSESASIGWVGPRHTYWGWISRHINAIDLCSPSVSPSTNRLSIKSDVPAESKTDELERIKLMLADRSARGLKHVLALESRVDRRVSWVTPLLERIDQPRSLPKTRATKSKSTDGIPPKKTASKLLSSSSSPADSLAIVLGEDWPGHRRTFPLPDPCVPFYWYELFDRILPWCEPPTDNGTLNATEASVIRKRVPVIGPHIADAIQGCTPRVAGWMRDAQIEWPNLSRDGITCQALVVTDTTTNRELWRDILSRLSVSVIFASPHTPIVDCEPDFVLLDVSPPPRQSLAFRPIVNGSLPVFQHELVSRVRSKYPASMLGVFDAFPRWETWQVLTEMGVDALFPKPFSSFGLRWCLQRWISNE